MKDNDSPTLITIPSSTVIRKDTSSSKAGVFLDKNRYKLSVLAAILLLAFWSMFTGCVTLKWSAGNLSHVSDDLDIPTFDDLDILEVEERETVVRHMWDLYTQSSRTSTSRLPRFWQEAFEAAFEHLSSDVAAVRDAADSEIAKMSIRSIVLDPIPLQSTEAQVEGIRRGSLSKNIREMQKKRSKKAEESKKVTTLGSSS